jgi:hypothetical protein
MKGNIPVPIRKVGILKQRTTAQSGSSSAFGALKLGYGFHPVMHFVSTTSANDTCFFSVFPERLLTRGFVRKAIDKFYQLHNVILKQRKNSITQPIYVLVNEKG